jgi:UDP:flavonoid glycosyltransferase YjiC (YdhE family)
VLSNVGTLGDLHPFIAIASRLKTRGYDTVIATSPDFRENVVGEGLDFHPIGPSFADIVHDLQIDAAELGRRIVKDTMYILEAGCFPYLRTTYDDLQPALEGASLVLAGSLMYCARLAAEKRGLAHMTIALQPMVFLSAYDPPSLGQAPWLAPLLIRLGPTVTRAVHGMGKRLAARRARPLYAFRRALGLPQSAENALFEGQFSAHGTLAAYSPLLGAIQPDYPARTIIAGHTFHDRAPRHGSALPPDLLEFIAAGDAPLVFTLGSFAVEFPGDFYRVSRDAARALGRRAILLIGLRGTESIEEASAKDMHVCRYAPFSALFPHARAIIHHGGIGTLGQALRAGKPQLVVPHLADQFDNAARVARLGVGRWIGHNRYSPRRAARELAELLENPAYRTRAAAVGLEVGREDGADAAVQMVDRFFAEQSADRGSMHIPPR